MVSNFSIFSLFHPFFSIFKLLGSLPYCALHLNVMIVLDNSKKSENRRWFAQWLNFYLGFFSSSVCCCYAEKWRKELWSLFSQKHKKTATALRACNKKKNRLSVGRREWLQGLKRDVEEENDKKEQIWPQKHGWQAEAWEMKDWKDVWKQGQVHSGDVRRKNWGNIVVEHKGLINGSGLWQWELLPPGEGGRGWVVADQKMNY